jgi:hypothetical protein
MQRLIQSEIPRSIFQRHRPGVESNRSRFDTPRGYASAGPPFLPRVVIQHFPRGYLPLGSRVHTCCLRSVLQLELLYRFPLWPSDSVSTRQWTSTVIASCNGPNTVVYRVTSILHLTGPLEQLSLPGESPTIMPGPSMHPQALYLSDIVHHSGPATPMNIKESIAATVLF